MDQLIFFYIRERATGKVESSYDTMILASRLGNATAADVRSGKTFTSEKGVKITGSAKLET